MQTYSKNNTPKYKIAEEQQRCYEKYGMYDVRQKYKYFYILIQNLVHFDKNNIMIAHI